MLVPDEAPEATKVESKGAVADLLEPRVLKMIILGSLVVALFLTGALWGITRGDRRALLPRLFHHRRGEVRGLGYYTGAIFEIDAARPF